ncbi:DUF4241 domain-containing protein [Dermacoccaceae bacterium W4C1]
MTERLQPPVELPHLPASDARQSEDLPWWRRRAHWLYTQLSAGQLTDHADDKRYPVTLWSLGELAFPAGELILGDPYLLGVDEFEPIAQRLLPQPYLVAVATAMVDVDHPRNAAALLLLPEATIVDWDLAHEPGQDVRTLGPTEIYGYGVDAGTGSFVPARALPALERVMADDAGMLEEPISRVLFANENSTGPGDGTAGAGVVAPEPGADPVAVFSSGWGDGFYPTYLGLNAAGEVVAVVTDFEVAADPWSEGD